MRDTPGDPITPPQATRSVVQVALLQGLADTGAAHPLTAIGDGIEALDGKTVLLSHRLEHRVIADPPLAEAEIVADIKVADAEPVDQYLTYEGLCVDRGKRRIEADQQCSVDAARGYRLELLAKPGQARWRLLRTEKFQRLRLEDDHQRWQTGRARAGGQRGKDRLMADMYTVEIANGGNAVTVFGAQIVQAPDQKHGKQAGLKEDKPCSISTGGVPA